MQPGRLSLAKQIEQLGEADYDPGDLQETCSDIYDGQPEDSATRAHYIEVGPSSLRNALPSVADRKYEGMKVSRKQLLEETDEDLSDANERQTDLEAGEDEDMTVHKGVLGRGMNEENISDEDSPSESDEYTWETSEGAGGGYTEEPPSRPSKKVDKSADGVASTLKKAREEDTRKGEAVKRQITLWDTLLDTRIRLQKSTVSANRIPVPSQMKSYLDAPDCHDALLKFLNEAFHLTDELDELQERLLMSNNTTGLPPRKRRKVDSKATLDEFSEDSVTRSEDNSAFDAAFHPHLLQTLSKWSAKIQAVAPSVLLPSNRGAFLKGNQSAKSAIKLIDETLADNEKLLVRTQVARVGKPRVGALQYELTGQTNLPDTEIFDDTDFYQRILRGIIDARGNGDKEEDWMFLQKQKKAKKTVDAKASKGRKLRYEVHEKIQNFMVPVPVLGAWHDEQIDELFASLLGNGFENVTCNTPQVQHSIEYTGFKVFG